MTNQKTAVDLRTAAQIAGVSHYTLRRRIADGTLPAHRVGPKLIRVYVEDLERLTAPLGASA